MFQIDQILSAASSAFTMYMAEKYMETCKVKVDLRGVHVGAAAERDVPMFIDTSPQQWEVNK